MQIFIDKMPTELECQTQGCNHGEGGARWKTSPLTEDKALEMLKLHRADAHGQQIGGGGGAVHDGGGGKVQLGKIPCPVICGGYSQEDFKYFKRTWNQYISEHPMTRMMLSSETSCCTANSTMAGNLGVFYAKVRGEHWETGEVVIKGNIVLIQGGTGDAWLHSQTLPESWRVSGS